MKHLMILGILLLCACGRSVPDEARIVVAGDSIMAWNRSGGDSVADGLERRLREPVGDVSLSFARLIGGGGALNIPSQLNGVVADWVVLNGGANDLSGSGCGCRVCDSVLDGLISESGTRGAIPELVAELRRRGSRVVWLDYYTSPRYAGTSCVAPYRILKERLDRMAAADQGVIVLDLDSVFQSDDLSLFSRDRVHPSRQGSGCIADLVAPVLIR
ncbi:SGNH/GDSL hydrolase family protein [Phaeobacter inhibens]|uniref:SGNH/GDSL hydrolase family protein n=1 Tax=Phaeobacter inhibens TaxID=221822 RepID=UPI000160F3AC|nr:putative lipolytic enzyme [Phaeobacter inhibens 2.10]AXT43877.1 SGNH/GDSL hydrolase family protein [Phaeobacter inhibens]